MSGVKDAKYLFTFSCDKRTIILTITMSSRITAYCEVCHFSFIIFPCYSLGFSLTSWIHAANEDTINDTSSPEVQDTSLIGTDTSNSSMLPANGYSNIPPDQMRMIQNINALIAEVTSALSFFKWFFSCMVYVLFLPREISFSSNASMSDIV